MKNLILMVLLFYKNLFCKNEPQPEPGWGGAVLFHAGKFAEKK